MIHGSHCGALEIPCRALASVGNGGCGRFLYEDIAVTPCSKAYITRSTASLEGHHETGHAGIGDGDGLPVFDLVR